MAARSKRVTRYAVVGLGHIAQIAVLPAFAHARNASLAALFSDDATKRDELSARYEAPAYPYEQYDERLQSGDFDAVYIALPNHLHCDYAVRAARAGRHVLCEKPLGVTEEECRRMIDAAAEANVRLMTAYRLHFERATLTAIDLAQSGRLGDLKSFDSTFTMQVRAGDIRVQAETGGGTLYDIGIYCINAARHIFRSYPSRVFAVTAKSADSRFREVDETASVVMSFPENRTATFTSSFGSADVSTYRVVGTVGDLRVEPAYEYAAKLAHHLTLDGQTKKTTFPGCDQFAPELIHFSRCIQKGEDPEPDGWEGLADVRIIQALYQSAREGRAIDLEPVAKQRWPSRDQEIRRPPVRKPKLVHADSPSL